MRLFSFKMSFMLFLILCLIAMTFLTACATTKPSPAQRVELQRIKKNFETGYYKSAMRDALPLAADGIAEAQYAVGYMYYYGYGVTQDVDVGYFWIKRAARQGFVPAVKAVRMITSKKEGIAAIAKKPAVLQDDTM